MSVRLPSLLGILVAVGILSATALVVSGLHASAPDVRVSAATVVEFAPQSATQAPKAAMLPTGGVGVDEEWLRRTARAAGIPVPALRAYARASLLLGAEQPGCALGWTTLAGIGWVEAHHGTLGGRALREDGHATTPILGPALDGVGPVKAIPAPPPEQRWHDNARWDHAVGPMQFISSTWQRWGTDGDGDGVADPNDIDDAAHAAARYLCADGRALDTASGWSAAVFSYNHSDAYVRQVYAAATTYGERTSG